MIKFIVENLASKNEQLQTHCACAIFKCAEDGKYEGSHFNIACLKFILQLFFLLI